MRIECDQCRAAFTIDDALISDRGVRAQCPRCGQQKIVRRTASGLVSPGAAAGAVGMVPPPPGNPFGSSTDPSSPFGAAPSSSSPFGASPPSSSPFGASPPTGDAFGSSSSSPSSSPFGASPPPSSSPFGAVPSPGNPFGALSPSSSSSPFGAVPSPGNPFGAPSPSSSSSPFGAVPSPGNPFGAPSSPAARSASASPAPSPLSDPFGAPAMGNPFGAPPSSSGSPFGGGASAHPLGPLPASSPQSDGDFDGPSQATFSALSSASLGLSSAPFDPQDVDTFAAAPTERFGAASGLRTGTQSLGPAMPTGLPSEMAPGLPLGAPSSFGDASYGALRSPSPSPSPSPFAPHHPASPSPFAAGGFGSHLPATDPFSAPALPSSLDLDRPGSERSSVAPRETPAPSPSASDAIKWVVRRAGPGGVEHVVELSELRQRVKAGEVSLDDFAAPLGSTLRPLREQPLFAPQQASQKLARPRGARAALTLGELAQPLLRIAGIAAALGLVAGVVMTKPWTWGKDDGIGPNPILNARPIWKQRFPDLKGSAETHLAEGRRLMHMDTVVGYRTADEEFRQALLLDPDPPRAIAAWVENLANLPQVRSDLGAANLAQEAIGYASRVAPDDIDVMRAQGALFCVFGRIDEALRILNRVQQLAPADVATKLWIARSNIERSPAEALELLQRDVRARDADNPLAQTLEGAARRRLGSFAMARELLAARLVLDPQNVGALRELARLELDVGNHDAALSALSRLLAAEDKDIESHLLRAKIHYQLKRGPEGLKAADAYLDDLIAKHQADAGDLLVLVLAHATYVKTQLGALDAALALGERARALDATSPPALYALARAALAKNDAVLAKSVLEQAVRASATREQFYEPLLRADLAMLQGKTGDLNNAIRNAERAIELDPRNLRAAFGLAALYANEKKLTQAMTVMRKTLDHDPLWEREHVLPTDFPTLPQDVLPFAEVFRTAVVPPGDESLPSLRASSEGMIRFFAGQRSEAEKLFVQALKTDPQNHAAVLYLSILELENGRSNEPRARLADYIRETASAHPVTLLYAGRAEAAAGNTEAARKRFADLVETEPTLHQARYSQAMLLKKKKLDAQASEELRAILKQDPDYLPAKRALDGAG
jgi:predicted Zn finger-like uncharacterized protein